MYLNHQINPRYLLFRRSKM